jgi:uncharacterized membrane protein
MNEYDHNWRRPGYYIAFGVLALLVIIGGSLLLIRFVFPPPAGGFYYTGFPFFPFGIFWFFLFIFMIFGVSRWIFWGWGRRRSGYYSGRYYDNAHQILRERYARGEITKQQLDQMTRDLEQHDQT